MKKVIALFSALLIAFSVTLCVSAAADEEVLCQLGITSPVSEDAKNEIVTRAGFAYSMIKLINGEEYEPCETVFEDVDADNEYSGYINMLNKIGLVQGRDGEFEPDAGITLGDAYYIILKYIGYEVFQSKYSDYTSFAVSEASKLGLDKAVTASEDGYLTKKGLGALLGNALTMEYIDTAYYQDSIHKISILSDKLKINAYRATVESVSYAPNRATLKITDSYSKVNNEPLADGTTCTLEVSGNVNISAYENAPIIVYIREDEEIVAAVLQKNAEIRYMPIYAVNDDDDETSKYLPSAITSIATYEENKEYRIGDDFTIKYNDEIATEPVPLAGKYAKFIFVNNRIVYLEAWELESGGILQSASQKEITYTRGSAKNAKLEFEDCDKIRVYINNELSSPARLKPDTYFDYWYKEDDFLVIAASEKKISDELSSVGENTLTIGNTEYESAAELYVSKLDGIYTKNNTAKEIIGNRVDALFNCFNKITYVRIASGEAGSYVSDFIGIVKRCEQLEDFSDGNIDVMNAEIYMLDVDGEAHTFMFTDKTKYGDDMNPLTFEDVMANRKKADGTGIYLFEVAKNGKIRSVKKPLPYQLTKRQTAPVRGTKGSFASDSNQSVIVNGKTIMFGGENITLIYEKDGELVISRVKTSDLQAKNILPAATLEFFGYDDRLDIRLIAAYGEGLANIYNYAQSFGIVSHKMKFFDEEDEIIKWKFDMLSKTENTLSLSEEEGKDLPKRAFVRFNTLVNKGINSAMLQDAYTVDLTQPVDEWDSNGILTGARVNQINSKAVRFDDGEVYFFNTKYLTVFEYKDDEFKLIDIEDVREYEKIYYHMSTYDGMEAICAVIVVR